MENTIPVEERQRLYELCKTYLSGKWTEVTANELIIKPVTDGFVNKLYYCGLPDHMDTKYNKVVVRDVDYEQFKDFYNQTHVIAMSVILSQINISPKLLAVFPNGTINEFIECRYFNATDDVNPKTVGLLARKLAKFHSLDMPIPKTTKNMTELFKDFFTEELKTSASEGTVFKQIHEYNLQTFKDLTLTDELSWLANTVQELKSPVVFSHNDFNRRNTLVRDSNVNNNKEMEIFLIDFDWTNYSYRGADFGQYFCSWGQKETDFGSGDFPTDPQMALFIDAYIEEMIEINGNSYAKHEINSRERITKEAKLFALMAFMKDIMYCIWQTTLIGVTDLMPKAEVRFNCYRVLKKRILHEYPDLQ
ncbi:unnamed protein product [Oppiella nova]|uniref:Choline/ethanolamine kinase n=1 Tax=Oppiella nova TaxID=334625 RepID=A0A7R9QD28_9ACAR|nr:unnamed protein product [Oppiella nova]CAG2162584.1 unnamed protein product [Oppiella nova]